jgi:DNA-binding NarL/FixJ family response regulator
MKVLIADDHQLFREGLHFVLDGLNVGVCTIVEACDFSEAIAVADREEGIDLALMDLGMPGMAWEDGLRDLKNTLPTGIPIVILSASDDQRRVRQAIALGAAGYIPKTSSSRVMLSALQLVMAGGVYLPAAMLDQVEGGGTIAKPTASFLTPRQSEVLALLGEGKSNKEIARVLQLAEGTVKLHVTAILKGLNVNNRTRAVVAASQLGLSAKELSDGRSL